VGPSVQPDRRTRFVNVDDRPWLTVAVMTAVITGPLSVIVWAATGLFFAQKLYPLAALPQLFGPVLVVTLAVTTVNVFLGRAQPVQTHAAPASPAPASPPPVRFLDRLPLKLRGATLYAVQAEDHYLRLHTDRGSDLILMRLSDAVEELEGLEGARTHRSWWVARSAVRGVDRGDGRATLTLEGGLSVPGQPPLRPHPARSRLVVTAGAGQGAGATFKADADAAQPLRVSSPISTRAVSG
jgi:hypothetical protein